MDAGQKYVFISYVRDNQAEVDRLADDLRRFGIQVWLDRETIHPGERWRNAIYEAIEQGANFLACFSEEYLNRQKSFMNDELALAINELRQYPAERRWFIPIRLSDCEIPDRDIGGGETLRDLQRVDLFANRQTALDALLRSLSPAKRALPRSGNEIVLDTSRPFEARLQEVIKAWIGSGRSADWLINGQAFFAGRCWAMDRKKTSVSSPDYDADIADFIATSCAALGGSEGWDRMLRERLACSGCYESYRGENMSINVQTMRYLCPRCNTYSQDVVG